MNITASQIRAARGLLDWSQQQLATTANVGLSTIRSFETGKRVPIVNNLHAIRTALEAAGVIFIDQNGNGPGVRLRDRQA
jgi:transcriptional regulator with XRE-family HTH domain